MRLTFLAFFLSVSLPIFSQTGCPEVIADPVDVTIDCLNPGPITLSADFADIGETNVYTVESIPFDPPYDFDDGNYISTILDDSWSPEIALPFTFCFFGSEYNSLWVGTNGVVSFNTQESGEADACPWVFDDPVPHPNFPIKNAIFGAYHDMDNFGNGQGKGDMYYGTVGTAPCRAFIVNFDQFTHFRCYSIFTTQQIVMYENTNIIDVYIKNKPLCNTQNVPNAKAVIGIINSNGNSGYTPPNRNTGYWEAENEAWRFLPDGNSIVDFSWKDAAGNIISTDASIVVDPTMSTTYTANAIYNTCDGNTINAVDEVEITYVDNFLDINDPNPFKNCDTPPMDGQLAFDLTVNDPVINYTSNTDYEITYHTTAVDAQNGTNVISTPSSYVNTSNPQIIYVRVEDMTTNCLEFREFTLEVDLAPTNNTPNDFELCDDDNDGIMEFDLSTMDSQIKTIPTDVVTYYLSQAEAETKTNPLPLNYTPSVTPTTVYARVDNDTDCFNYEEIVFNLIVNPLPNANNGIVYSVCSVDTTAEFDLPSLDTQVTNESGVTITYHETNIDSGATNPPLASPYVSGDKTIFARISFTDTSCFVWQEVNLEVLSQATATTKDLENCSNTSTSTFDLDDYLTQLQTTNPSVDLSIHISQADASSGANELTGIFTNTSNPQTLYVRVEDATKPDCPGLEEFQLTVVNPASYNSPPDFELCDDDIDGFQEFNLSLKDSEILVNASDDISYHLSQADAETGANPLPSNYTNTSNPQSIYVRIDNQTGCFPTSTISFNLVVNELPGVIPNQQLEDCSETSTGSFDLTLLDSSVTSDADVSVTYHESNIEDPTTNPALSIPYDSPSTSIWARVENNTTLCASWVEVELIVINPSTITTTNLEHCSNTDQYDFDLTTYLNNLQASFPRFTLSIHETRGEAETGVNPLSGTYTNTSNPQKLFVRVEDASKPTCPGVEEFELIVKNPASYNTPSNFELCDDNTDQNESFNLTSKTSEILVDAGDDISYHLTQTDAETGANPLPNTYRNTTNPETIYVRIDNHTGCFPTSVISFDLIVNPKPLVNEGVEYKFCSQTTEGIFDLSSLDSQVTSETDCSVTYHTTNTEPVGGSNPALPNEYATESTTVWARVMKNGTGCATWVDVTLLVIVAPKPNTTRFETCEIVNATGMAEFDLDAIQAQLIAETNLQVDLYDDDTFTTHVSGLLSTSTRSVYALVQDISADACDGKVEIELIVNPQPEIIEYSEYNCRLQENSDLFTFDTSVLDPTYSYTVFENMGDTVPVTFPYQVSSDNTRLYVYTENRTTGCSSYSTLDLIISDFSDNYLDTIDVCYKDSYVLPDGREIFDDGEFEILNIETCVRDIYIFDFYGCNCTPDLPTAFSPSTTRGTNDKFSVLEPKGCTVSVTRFEIFNRWGEKVFETDDVTNGWDGQFNGIRAQQGTYLWHLEYEYVTDRNEEGDGTTSGTIFLLK